MANKKSTSSENSIVDPKSDTPDSLPEIDGSSKNNKLEFDPESIRIALQEREKAEEEREKEFQKKIKDLEPNDLLEIPKIISEIKKDTAKEKNEYKVRAFYVVLEKINSIIDNSRNGYYLHLNHGDISEPEEFFIALDIANNQKRQFEIEIVQLQLETSKQAEPNIDNYKKSINDFPLETNNLTTEPSTDKLHITLKELAIKLSVSESTLYHNKGIIKPYLSLGGYRFTSSDIDKLRMDFKSKSASKKNVDAVSKMPIPNRKKKHHFTFQVSLEPFTNVFREKEYLDEDNVILMNDRFSKKPKLGNKFFIEWKKDTRSLITFIYLADRLGLIDKSRSINVRAHNTSFAEPKENDEEGREIKYTNLVNENFVIDAESGSSDPMLTRWWNGTLKIKGINMIICELRIQAAVKSGLITEEEEEKAKQKMTRKEAIEYYFAKKDSTYFRLDKDADRQMLDIVCEIMKEYGKQSPNTTKKRTLLEFSSASL